MTTFMIGCDPEIFLTKNGKAFSAHGVIPGTKESPHPVTDGAYQVDGLAVEFNTNPVVLYGAGGLESDFQGFDKNVTSVMKEMHLACIAHDPGINFNIAPVQDFDPEYLEAQPKEAKVLGCNPDFNAYTLKENEAPDGDAVSFRTAAGHIHIGWGADIPVDHPDHLEICANFIKYMDATVGMFMTLLDTDPRRRILYGKAGAFRPKSYGAEYRTPSSLWLTSKDSRRTIFELSKIAVTCAQNEYRPKNFNGMSTFEETQKIIDEGDYEGAKKCLDVIINNFYLEYKSSLVNAITEAYNEKLKADGKPIPKKKEKKPKLSDYTVTKTTTADVQRVWDNAVVWQAERQVNVVVGQPDPLQDAALVRDFWRARAVEVAPVVEDVNG